MNLQELKQYVEHHRHFEIRMIKHAGSRVYQVELEDGQGERHALLQRGKPLLFRDIEDVYLQLKGIGINRAYLVEHVAPAELMRGQIHYHGTLTPRTPVVF